MGRWETGKKEERNIYYNSHVVDDGAAYRREEEWEK